MPELEAIPIHVEHEDTDMETTSNPEFEDDFISSTSSEEESPSAEIIYAARIVHSSNVRHRQPSGSLQPTRDPQLQLTLTAEVEINGVKAFTLFDSGSTTDSITPEFVFVTRAKQFMLDDQVVLQLGCVGSRSKISYGTKVPLILGSIHEDTYFDLVNLDRYDCILGTPFLLRHGVILDFGKRSIQINGIDYPAFTIDEEKVFLANKKETIFSKKQSRLPPRDTLPIASRRNPEVFSD
jgi:hypothetical protein